MDPADRVTVEAGLHDTIISAVRELL